jgi:hypothetical protein
MPQSVLTGTLRIHMIAVCRHEYHLYMEWQHWLSTRPMRSQAGHWAEEDGGTDEAARLGREGQREG